MAKASLVDKKVKLELVDIIKFQIFTHCFIYKTVMSESEVSCLSLLGLCGETELSEFCNVAVNKGVFKTSQTVRNFLTKAEKTGFVVKNGRSRKKISLNPALKIQTAGNIILDFKIFHINGS